MSADTLTELLRPPFPRTPPMPPRLSGVQGERQIVAAAATATVENLPSGTTSEELVDVIARMNRFILGLRRDVHFAIETRDNRQVVLVVDAESGEALREISPDNVLAVARLLADSLVSGF